MRQKTRDSAIGKWRGILTQLGIEDRFLTGKQCPCPVCGGKDRFVFDDREGAGTSFCRKCVPNARDGLALVMDFTGMKFPEAAKAVDEIVGNVEYRAPKAQRDPRDRLNRIRQGLAPMDSINPVRKYLQSRGLRPSSATRFHPALAYFEAGEFAGKFPAMLHAFMSVDGKPLTWHVTYLDQSGAKAAVETPRKVLPGTGPLTGGAIRLFEPAHVMGIAEGIETAMAAHELFRIPVWSTYSATMLEQWEPPACCRSVVIFGDNDSSYTGQKAAFSLASRLEQKGYGVDVRIPDQTDTDWADEVRA